LDGASMRMRLLAALLLLLATSASATNVGHITVTDSTTLASLPSTRTIDWCSDCTVGTSPCTGSGSGAWAFRQGSQWDCPVLTGTASDLSCTGCMTSADLATALTNETGTAGAAVFSNSPIVDSPTFTTKINAPSVTALPGSPTTGDVVVVTDDSAAGACDSAAGSAKSICRYSGSAWEAIGDGGGGGGSGDITDVWTDTGGDVSALVAAAGDTLDAGSADSTNPCKEGTSAPATCGVGECFFDTDATAGVNLYGCTATNTWTLLGDGGGGGSGDVTDVWGCTTGNCNALTAASGDTLDAGSADSTIACKKGTAAPGTCTVGECFFDTDAIVGSNLLGCTATNTWRALNHTIWLSSSEATFSTSTAQSFAVMGTSTPDDSTSTQFRPVGTLYLSNLTCALLTAVPGSGKSWTINLRVGGSDSALQVSIADSAAVSSTDTDTVTVAGDGAAGTRILYWVTPTSTPAASRISCSVHVSF
jgi:hypothetical protein